MSSQDIQWVDDLDRADCPERIIYLPQDRAEYLAKCFLVRQSAQTQHCVSARWKHAPDAFVLRRPRLDAGAGVEVSIGEHAMSDDSALYRNVCRIVVRGSMVRLGSDSLHILARLKVATAAESDGLGTCLLRRRPGLSDDYTRRLDAFLDEIGAFHRAPESYVCAACNVSRNRHDLSVILDRETSKMWIMGRDCEEAVLGHPSISPYRWDCFSSGGSTDRGNRIDPQPVFQAHAFKAELVLSLYAGQRGRCSSEMNPTAVGIRNPHERFAKMIAEQKTSPHSWFNTRFSRKGVLDYSELASDTDSASPIIRQLVDPQNPGYLPITTIRELRDAESTVHKIFIWAEDAIGIDPFWKGSSDQVLERLRALREQERAKYQARKELMK